jgi:hypothetical protein
MKQLAIRLGHQTTLAKSLVIISLLLVPSLAHAMAQVIQAAGLAVMLFTPYGWAGMLIMLAGTVYGAEQARKAAAAAQQRAKDAYNAGLQDRLITSVATDTPFRYAYGRVRVGSAVVAMFSSGSNDQYKHLVCIHAAHECDAIEEIYINGIALGALDGNGDVTGGNYSITNTVQNWESKNTASFSLAQTPVAGTLRIVQSVTRNGKTTHTNIAYALVGTAVTLGAPYVSGTVVCIYQYLTVTSRVRVQKHLGTASDPADATLLAEVPGKWNANAVLRGMCYTVVRLDQNQPEFQSGLPSVQVLLRGKKLYDLRDGSQVWSQNNALAIYDYLTSEMCGVAGDTIVLSGTAQAGAMQSLTLAAGANTTPDFYAGMEANITGGTGAGQSQQVVTSRKNFVPNSDLLTWSSYTNGTATVSVSHVFDATYGNVTRITKTAGAVGDRAGVLIYISGLSGISYALSALFRVGVAGSLGPIVYCDANKIGGGLITVACTLTGSEATGVWLPCTANASNASGMAGTATLYSWMNGAIGTYVDIVFPQMELGLVSTAPIVTAGTAAVGVAIATPWATLPDATSVYELIQDGDMPSADYIAAANVCAAITGCTYAQSGTGVVVTKTAHGLSVNDVREIQILSGAPSPATVTMTIAAPAVVSWTAHGLSAGSPFIFGISGSPWLMPIGVLSAALNSDTSVRGPVYYVLAAGLTANAFQFSTAPGGDAVMTTGAQAGVLTAQPIVSGHYLITGATANTFSYTAPISLTASGNCTVAGLYTLNGTVTADQDPDKTMEAMAQSMAGFIVKTTWSISAGKYIAPMQDLLQSDIVGALAVTPGLSDANIYNGIKGSFACPANSYVATDFAPFQNAAYLAADGRELWTNIDFAFTDSPQRIWNLCTIFVEDQRNGYSVTASFSLKVWQRQIGQRVTLTSAFLGQSAKVYRITDKKYAPDSAVELSLKEDAATIWDMAPAITPDETPNTSLPNQFDIAPLASLTCLSDSTTVQVNSDGTMVPRILASWPQATTQAVVTNGSIEIEWQLAGDTAWSKAKVSGADVSTYLAPVSDGLYYTVRARTVNSYLNTKSDWTYASHQVWAQIPAPADVANFAATVVSDGVLLTWDANQDVALAEYEVHAGGANWAASTYVGNSRTTQLKVSPQSSGTNTWWIKALNYNQIYSVNGVSCTLNVSGANAPIVTQQVVDNNVLLYWTQPASAQLISTYEIRRGATYGSSTLIGNKSGLFTTVFETLAGTYTYWVTAIDIGGNYGTPGSVSAAVNQPPDYVLNTNLVSTFAGNVTLNNAEISQNTVVLPVNLTETFAQHFTVGHTWAGPDAQIAAGYPVFAQPALSTGYYEEWWDLGSTLAASKITLALNSQIAAGAPVTTPTISVSNTSGVAGYTDYAGVTAVYATSFRWVKIRIAVASGLTDLLQILGISVRLDVKLKNDAGSVACVSTDNSTAITGAAIGGTTVLFTQTFAAITSITLTAQGTTVAYTPIYDFNGAANPVGFKVYLYNAAGARVSGTVSWSVKGY